MKILLFTLLVFLLPATLFSQSCDSIVIRSYQILSQDGWRNDSIRIDSFQNHMLHTRSGYSLSDTALIPVYRNENTYDSIQRLLSFSEYQYYSPDSFYLSNYHFYNYSNTGKISTIENYVITGGIFVLSSTNNYTYDINDSLIYYDDFNGASISITYSSQWPYTYRIENTGILETTFQYDSTGNLVNSAYISNDGFANGTITYVCNGQMNTYYEEYNSGSVHDHVIKTGYMVYNNCIPQFEYFHIMDIGILEGDYRVEFNYATCNSIAIIADDTLGLCANEVEQMLISILGGITPYSYNWTPSTGLSSDTVLIPVVQNALDTIYTLTVTDSSGLIVTKSFRFLIRPEPVSYIIVSSIDSVSNCSSAILSIANIDSNYCTWYLDGSWIGNSDSSRTDLFINHNGIYTLTVSSNIGCTGFDTLAFTSLQNPSPSVSFNQDCNDLIAFCPTTVNYQWLWYNNLITNATNDTLNITQNGSYSVIATNSLGCSDTSISHYYSVYRISTSTNVLCDSACNGTLYVSSTYNINSVIWSTGDSTSQVHNICPGIYSVTVTDYRGCSLSATDTILLNAPEIVLDSITNASCITCFDGSAFVTLYNGIPPYQYTGSGTYNNGLITGLGPGNNLLTFIDHNNCPVSISVNIGITLGTESLQLKGTIIYPNPVSDILTFNKIHFLHYQIKIIDAFGKTLYSGVSLDENTFDFTSYSPGVYNLFITSENTVFTEKVIVVH